MGESIVIRRNVFGRGCYVSTEPLRVDRPSVMLPDAVAARRYADERSRETGLPVDDRTEDRHG
jgi:hypothetical protein